MAETSPSIQAERPDFGLFDPIYHGSGVKHRVFSLIASILAIFFSIYLFQSFIKIVKESGVTIFFNLILLTIEALIGYYSILYLWHFARTFKGVNQPLEPRVSKKDIDEGNVPPVTVLIPIFKEPFNIVKQTIQAALKLNYPKARYDVVVMEDGAEGPEIKEMCSQVGAGYLTRGNREHFKAGAVNYALPKLKGDYVLFIDADHILERNIILNCLSAWRKDSIAVQARVDFVNIQSLFTTVAAYLQIQFFSLFQRARRSSGSAIFAGGSALFDRQMLLDNGGLNPLTIADDTDTSFILRARGLRIEYIDTIGSWALVPWDPLHMIRQVWRWLTGITRSFRARSKVILTGKSSIYVKIDHFSTAMFPTIAVAAWLSGFVIVGLIILEEPIIRTADLSSYNLVGPILLAVISVPVIVGVSVLFINSEQYLYSKVGLKDKVFSISAFYIFVFAAQPLLVGAVFKGLFGTPVVFNRTPKVNKIKDKGLTPIKTRYFLMTVVVFLIASFFLYFALTVSIADSRGYALLFSIYPGMIPIVVSFLWFWKLEDYLAEVGDISALDVLKTETSKIQSPDG